MVQPSAHRHTNPEGDKRAAIRALEINRAGLIHGNVDHFWIGRKDVDAAVIANHFLLRGALQIAQSLGLGTKPLYGIHYVLGLVQERFSQSRRPGQIIVQPLQQRGVPDQCLYLGSQPC